MKNVCLPVSLSRLAKSRTMKLNPESWTAYPSVKITGHQIGQKIKESLRTEKAFREWKKAERTKLYTQALNTSEEWNRSMRASGLKNALFSEPLRDKLGRPILTKSEYCSRSKQILEEATGQPFRRAKPRVAKFNGKKDIWIDYMMEGIPYVNTNSACGPDGCHPIWIEV